MATTIDEYTAQVNQEMVDAIRQGTESHYHINARMARGANNYEEAFLAAVEYKRLMIIRMMLSNIPLSRETKLKGYELAKSIGFTDAALILEVVISRTV